MKSCLKSALIVFSSLLFSEIHAQIKPGYIFGVNLSTITLNSKAISSNPETPVGIHFGGYFEIPITGHLNFEPEFLFSAKGSNYKIDSVEHSLSPIYIEIPVIIAYSLGSETFKFTVFAGPYFACGVGGYKIEPGGEMNKISYGSGESNDLKFLDAGLNFGAGLNIRGLLISAQYGLGLANIAPSTPIYQEMKNKVIGISISSLFEVK